MRRAAGIVVGVMAFASALPALADAGALETLRSECAAQLKLPPPACQCIVDRAAGLNDNQQAFVAASVTRDEAATTALRTQMSAAELSEAGMFMTTSPQACMQGG